MHMRWLVALTSRCQLHKSLKKLLIGARIWHVNLCVQPPRHTEPRNSVSRFRTLETRNREHESITVLLSVCTDADRVVWAAVLRLISGDVTAFGIRRLMTISPI